jgi:hypothetical protein
MTTLGSHPLDDPALLDLVADRWTPLAVDLADTFRAACRIEAATNAGWVHPSRVTARLKADDPELNMRRVSALWATATGRDGYLDNTEHWRQIDGAVSRGNGNKSVRLRRWRGPVPPI